MLARLLLLAVVAAPLAAQDQDVDNYLQELRSKKVEPRDLKAEQQQLVESMTKRLDSIKDPKVKADTYVLISGVYESLGDPGAAVAAARKARELAPEEARIAMALAHALLANGETSEVAALIGVDPTDGHALASRALEFSQHPGDTLPVAAYCAELAHKLLPDDLDVTDTLGSIYMLEGMSAKAILTLEQLVTQAPWVYSYHYHLARAFFQLGRKEYAISELQDALAWNPPDDDRQAIQNLLANLGDRK